MPTNELTGARHPEIGYAPDIPVDIRNAVNDLSKVSKPRFTNTAARDAAYSAWVAAGNTMQAGMECFTEDMGLHWSYTGSSWFLMAWSGSDQTKQPMISLRSGATNLGITASLFKVTTWAQTVNQGGGLLSVVSGGIRCNVPGKVRVQGYADSDVAQNGYSWLAINQVPAPTNGDLLPGLHDRRPRIASYGRLLQTVFSSNVPVKPNDTFELAAAQEHAGLTALSYNFWFTVSYI